MPAEAAELDRPRETATSSKASTGQRYEAAVSTTSVTVTHSKLTHPAARTKPSRPPLANRETRQAHFAAHDALITHRPGASRH